MNERETKSKPDWNGIKTIESAPKDGTRIFGIEYITKHSHLGWKSIFSGPTWWGTVNGIPDEGWVFKTAQGHEELWQPTHWHPYPLPNQCAQ